MNHRIILRILSRVAFAEAVLLLISGLVALLHGEEVLRTYGLPILLLLAYGGMLARVRPRSQQLFAREGFVAVALSWMQMSLFGALPLFLGGASPFFMDCLFETISGFTTTGGSVLPDVSSLPRGLLFWRSFTHWIGGMGVLVFLLTIIPLAGERSMHLMRAESPGPSVGKLVPRLQDSALILYGIYIALSLLQIPLLLLGGMSLLDSVTTMFSTAGTGGFFIHERGMVEMYDNPYLEVVITLFMLLFSINFSLYYLVLKGKPLQALKSEELRWFFVIFLAAALLLAAGTRPLYDSSLVAARHAAFQTASIMSTTGFSVPVYGQYSPFAQVVVLVLMIIGSCAGSTGGGFKVARVIILFKTIRREAARLIHPRSVGHVSFEKKTMEAGAVHAVLVYLAVYVMIMLAGFLLISLEGNDHITSFSAVVSCLNNGGAALGKVGSGSYALFSPFSKGVLSLLMLTGRLEIMPMLLLFMPSVWRRGG